MGGEEGESVSGHLHAKSRVDGVIELVHLTNHFPSPLLIAIVLEG